MEMGVGKDGVSGMGERFCRFCGIGFVLVRAVKNFTQRPAKAVLLAVVRTQKSEPVYKRQLRLLRECFHGFLALLPVRLKLHNILLLEKSLVPVIRFRVIAVQTADLIFSHVSQSFVYFIKIRGQSIVGPRRRERQKAVCACFPCGRLRLVGCGDKPWIQIITQDKIFLIGFGLVGKAFGP